MKIRSTLLIIDDDPDNQTVIEALLENDPYDLHFARQGRAGLLQMEVLQPDIVILDVMMPEMNGFEVCTEIRRRESVATVPILMVTALDDYPSLVQGLRAGADHFITKPLRQEEFRAKLATIANLNRYRQIAEQRDRFEQMFFGAPSASLMLTAGGAVAMANVQASFLLEPAGARPLVGLPIGTWFDDENSHRLLTRLNETIAGLDTVRTELPLVLDGGGRRLYLQARLSAVTDRGCPMAILILTDTTALVKAREELAALNRDLNVRVRERTAELEDANDVLRSYASFVSHDLRTPLSIIKGYLSFVLEGAGELEAATRERLRRCYQGVEDMNRVIHDLLSLVQSGKSTRPDIPVNLVPVLAKLAAHYEDNEPRIKGRIQIDAMPPVRVNPAMIERVIYNVLGNAVKYAADAPDPRIRIGCQQVKRTTVLFVSDNGPGFSTVESAAMFQDYSRSSPPVRKDGIGIGLSLVKKILRQYGCRLWVVSRPGEGATVFISLRQVRTRGGKARTPAHSVSAHRS